MSYQIVLNYLDQEEHADDAFDWARQNCTSFQAVFCYEDEFDYLIQEPTRYEFVFGDEKEAMLFGLKFGSHQT